MTLIGKKNMNLIEALKMLLNEIKNVLNTANKKELHKFGITIGIFLFMVAAYLFWKDRPAAEYVAYVSGGFLVLALVVPITLKPVYIAWMSFAIVMGFIMTRVILSILYGVVFTPAGLVVRLLRKDPLNEKIEPEATTYWIPRVRKPISPKSLENQF